MRTLELQVVIMMVHRLVLLVVVKTEKKKSRKKTAHDLERRVVLPESPAMAAAERLAVERRYAQLLAGKSTAYGLVARMSSFPVLMPGLEPSELGSANSCLGWRTYQAGYCLAHSISPPAPHFYGLSVFPNLSLS